MARRFSLAPGHFYLRFPMPRVAGKKYSYDRAGREAAARARKRRKSAAKIKTADAKKGRRLKSKKKRA
jgi:hypothetical protein